MVVFYAMSAIIGPFVGQNLGARKSARIVESLRVSAVFCLALGAVAAALLWLLAPWLSRLFSADPEVVAVTTSYLRIVPWSYGAAGIIMVMNAAFNGIGKPLPAVTISVVRTLFLYVPLAYGAAHLFGIVGNAWIRTHCRAHVPVPESRRAP